MTPDAAKPSPFSALEQLQARRIADLEDALSKIAAPKRPDGTYNLGREACERIAKEALGVHAV